MLEMNGASMRGRSLDENPPPAKDNLAHSSLGDNEQLSLHHLQVLLGCRYLL
jgi:hypothetical protein